MAGKKFYIADMHLGHKNVLRFDKRPFPNEEYMTEVMINRWNDCVSNDDTVYILGDMFWMGEKESVDVMHRLNGHKVLVKGNHDRIHGRLRFQFDEIVDYGEVNDGEHLVIMSHYPMPFYKNQRHGAIMLYGHVHNSDEWEMVEQIKKAQLSKDIPCRMINVGCMMDYMDYTPRTLDEILAANSSQPTETSERNTFASTSPSPFLSYFLLEEEGEGDGKNGYKKYLPKYNYPKRQRW